MGTQQEFWERLQKKYVDKNQTLQKRETELKYKLESLNTVIGDVQKDEQNEPVTQAPSQFNFVTNKSCACLPPQEKASFLKNFLAALPILKCKNCPSPSTSNPKDENCICNPCQVETSNNSGSKKDESICCCSVCEKMSNITYIQESNCNCSLSNKISNKEGLCASNCELLTDGEILLPTRATQRKESTFPFSSSKISLKSADLYYMKNIHELATQQKALLNNINDIEKKTRVYEDVFNEYQGFPPKEPIRNNINVDMSKADDKLTGELKIENCLLKNELKEMRLEVRQYIERMEGPMLFKIESEKYKNTQLEQKLEQTLEELDKMKEQCQQDINSLKMQLCNAKKNICNLTKSNKKVNEELEMAKAKYDQLSTELIHQKISEAESLKAMQSLLRTQRQNGAKELQEECSLHQAARELSEIIKKCEPCGSECIGLREDLFSTARMLKNLTDMIDQEITKKDDVQETPKTSEPTIPTEVKDSPNSEEDIVTPDKESEVVKDNTDVVQQTTDQHKRLMKTVSIVESLGACNEHIGQCE